MGNQLAQPQKLQPEHLAELNDVTLQDMLGGGRFLKTALCVHEDGGLVVVKVYYKRGDVPDLQPYSRQLKDIKWRLRGFPAGHVWPFQEWVETERACYLIRQHVYASLSHRLGTRPFLSHLEKLWIAYQLLEGLAAAHAAGVCHGDLKAENVLLTSWHWAYLADFASYKPVRLPADNPADFSFFFDTGGRRRCYLAPERFYEAQSPAAADSAAGGGGGLRPAMDVFSLGCVLAELFADGAALFDLSQLLAYRRGEHDPAPQLAGLPPPLRRLILHMIQLDPGRRLSAAEYLQRFDPQLFPPYFGRLLHPFLGSLATLEPDARVAAIEADFDRLAAGMADALPMAGGDGSQALEPPPGSPRGDPCGGSPGAASSPAGEPASASPRPFEGDLLADVGALLSDTRDLLGRLGSGPGGASEEGAFFGGDSGGGGLSLDEGYIRAGTPGASPEKPPKLPDSGPRERAPTAGRQPSGTAAEAQHQQQQQQRQHQQQRPAATAAASGMELIAAALCPLLRGARLQESKVRAVMLLAQAAALCDDDTRLRRVVPYLMAAVSEPQAAVRSEALGCLAGVLASVRALPPSDAKLISEYVLPSLSLVPNDGEESVRVRFSAVIAGIAASAQRLLEGQQLAAQRPAAAGEVAPPPVKYDAEVGNLRSAVERLVHELAVGAGSAAPARRALLPRLPDLVHFLGRKESNDFLLPATITFLNDREWQLRAGFFQHIACLAVNAGTAGLDAFLLPCLEQALADAEEAVVAAAAGFLTAITRRGLLAKRWLLAAAAKVSPRLLRHPATSVRAAAVEFVAAAAEQLPPADVHALLLPVVAPALAAEPSSLASQQELAACLLDPEPAEPPKPPLLPPPGRAPRSRPASRGATPRSRLGTPRSTRSSNLSSTQTPQRRRQHLDDSPAPSPVSPADADARPSLPGAPLYSLRIPAHHLQGGASILSAALEAANAAASQDGHVISAPASAAAVEPPPQAQRPQQRSQPGAGPEAGSGGIGGGSGGGDGGGNGSSGGAGLRWLAAAGTGRLVAHATRLGPKPADSLPGRLSLSLEEPLSLPRPPSRANHLLDAGAAEADGGGGRTSDAAGISIPSGAASPEPWHPRGVLVAHLAEHRMAVNQVAVAGNGAFFVSASADETVKVWDCRRLEKDVSFRSRVTYAGQGGRMLGVSGCEDGQSVASASASGSLRVWRVEYTTRGGAPGAAPDQYTGISRVQEVVPGEGAVLGVQRWGTSVLLFHTQRGGLHAWDLRTGRDAWVLPTQPRQGVTDQVAADPEGANWLLTGGSRGHCTLWDARFRLPVHAWRHPAGAIEALAPALAPPPQLGLPSRGPAGSAAASPPLVYVAAGPGEVGLWDVAAGTCSQVLRYGGKAAGGRGTSQPPPPALQPAPTEPAAAHPLDPAALAAHLHVPELSSPPSRPPGVRCLLATGAGGLLAGGTDAAIRAWAPATPAASYLVAAPPPPPSTCALTDEDACDAPHPACQYSQRMAGGVPVIDEAASSRGAHAASGGGRTGGRGGNGGTSANGVAPRRTGACGPRRRQAATAHRDAVLGLAAIEMAERMLVSCSRDGVVKVWK